MRGGRAELAVIVGRADDPFAEVMLPDAVDHHARDQRMLWAGEPLRELAPPAAGLDRRLGRPRDDLRKAAGDDVAEAIISTANVDRDILHGGEEALGRTALLDCLRDGNWLGHHVTE